MRAFERRAGRRCVQNRCNGVKAQGVCVRVCACVEMSSGCSDIWHTGRTCLWRVAIWESASRIGGGVKALLTRMGNSGNAGLIYLLCCCPLYASLWTSLSDRRRERIIYVQQGVPLQQVRAAPPGALSMHRMHGAESGQGRVDAGGGAAGQAGSLYAPALAHLAS